VTATPFGLGPLGGLSGLSNLGLGSANFMDLQQKMMREVFLSVCVFSYCDVSTLVYWSTCG